MYCCGTIRCTQVGCRKMVHYCMVPEDKLPEREKTVKCYDHMDPVLREKFLRWAQR